MFGKLATYFIRAPSTLKPISSKHSRLAADSADSSGLQKPPGRAKNPLRGSFARVSNKTSPAGEQIIRPTAAATLQ